MRIGIDIDDTIANTYESFFKIAIEYTKKNVNPNFKLENCSTKIITNMPYQELFDWTDEQDKIFWATYYLPPVILGITIKENAKQVINKLFENNEIFIITARSRKLGDNVEELTRIWLDNNGVKYHQLYMDAEEKLDICLKNKIDLFIDDAYYYCKQMKDNNIKTFMLSSEINKGIKDDSIPVFRNWKEIGEYLNIFVAKR